MNIEPDQEPAKAARVRRALVVANPKAKLLDQVREVCRLRHFSRRTEQTYVACIRRFLNPCDSEAGDRDRSPLDG